MSEIDSCFMTVEKHLFQRRSLKGYSPSDGIDPIVFMIKKRNGNARPDEK
jgi:hypothetical protein